MDNTQFVIFPGAFMVRATGVPVPAAPTGFALIAGIGALAGRRRR
jgi:MYXO-CTERM domain-containing protein